MGFYWVVTFCFFCYLFRRFFKFEQFFLKGNEHLFRGDRLLYLRELPVSVDNRLANIYLAILCLFLHVSIKSLKYSVPIDLYCSLLIFSSIVISVKGFDNFLESYGNFLGTLWAIDVFE